jgi:hypothetical protein
LQVPPTPVAHRCRTSPPCCVTLLLNPDLALPAGSSTQPPLQILYSSVHASAMTRQPFVGHATLWHLDDARLLRSCPIWLFHHHQAFSDPPMQSKRSLQSTMRVQPTLNGRSWPLPRWTPCPQQVTATDVALYAAPMCVMHPMPAVQPVIHIVLRAS